MILDKMDPPPRYTPKLSTTSLLSSFPPHLLLHIVYQTFPHGITAPDLEKQRKTLYWLSTSLRLVNRPFYTACMHVLRSTYLSRYLSLVKPPYTSDPFPVAPGSETAAPSYTPGSSLPAPYADPLHSIQRESSVLDLFIVVKVREDVWADDSELHLERHEFFKDLFELHQPRSRLEDLIRIYGAQNSLITLRPSSLYSSPSTSTATLASQGQRSSVTSRSFLSFGRSSSSKSSYPPPLPARPQSQPVTPIPFPLLSISFTSRKAGLVLTEKQRKRTIVSVQRGRQDTLEATARQLVAELKNWLREGGGI
jgi:hypothetical protein